MPLLRLKTWPFLINRSTRLLLLLKLQRPHFPAANKGLHMRGIDYHFFVSDNFVEPCRARAQAFLGNKKPERER